MMDMQFHVLNYFTDDCQPVVTVRKELGEDHLVGSLNFRNPKKGGYRDLGMITEALRKVNLVPVPEEKIEDDLHIIVKLGDEVYRATLTIDYDGTRNAVLLDAALLAKIDLDTMYEAPDEVFKMPFVGIRILLDEPLTEDGRWNKSETLSGREFELTNMLMNAGFMTGHFGNYGHAKVIPWVPQPGEIQFPSVDLPLEGPVTISAFFSPKEVYLRPNTNTVNKMHEYIVNYLSRFIEQRRASGLSQEIYHCRDLVGAQWINGAYQRAIITRRRGEYYCVRFLDFGNRSRNLVSSQLSPLPTNLEKFPTMSVKVGLADIPEPVFSDWARRLLDNLFLRPWKVRVKHEGDLSKVTLYNASYGGVHRLLNAEVSEGAPPNLLKDYFSGGDVEYKLWPENLTGTVATIPGNSVQEFIFIGTPDDHQQFIKNELTPEMKKYSEALEIGSYTPRVNEFVLVRLGADWCRAIATPKENMKNSVMVYFIDYGHDSEARFENIRPAVRRFVLVPASVKSCNILGMKRCYFSSIFHFNVDYQTNAFQFCRIFIQRFLHWLQFI